MKLSKAKKGLIAISVVIAIVVIVIIAFSVYTQVIPKPTQINETFWVGGRNWPTYYRKGKWDRVLSFGNTRVSPQSKFAKRKKMEAMYIKTSDSGSGIDNDTFTEIMSFLHEGDRNNERILVNCVFGKNRSVSALTAYLMKKNNSDWETEFNKIKSKRKVAAPWTKLRNLYLKYLQQ